MKKKKDRKLKRDKHIRKGVKKRHDEFDADPENPEETEACLFTADKRCRSLEDLPSTGAESKELKKSVRINSIRKTKSVDDILREQVEEVKEAMHKNLLKIRDRNGKLDDLVEKGDTLTGSCAQFQMVSNKVVRKQKLRVWKTRILLAVAVAVGIVVLIVVIVVVVVTQQEETPQTNLYLGSFNHGPSNETS